MYCTKEQIAAAKQMGAMEFLRRFRPGELVSAGSRGEYQLRSHDSFKISASGTGKAVTSAENPPWTISSM